MMTPCLEWDMARDKNGYGYINHDGKVWKTHRLQWTLVEGPIPEGMWVLHHCDNPSCFEISHLYLGDNIANVRDRVERGRGGTNGNERKTHCPQGHAYDEANTIVGSRGQRTCRACTRNPDWVTMSARTHCPYGHPYSGDNLRVDVRGWRKCRECSVRRQREARLVQSAVTP